MPGRVSPARRCACEASVILTFHVKRNGRGGYAFHVERLVSSLTGTSPNVRSLTSDEFAARVQR